MKNSLSLLACIVVSLFLLYHRGSHPGLHSEKPLNVTAWDAFGYYMYLPSILIYNDMTQLEWLPEADSAYGLTGGTLYQSHRQENGNYVNKYLGGVSIMELPFFLIGHAIATITPFKADGFSPPYQYAIALGAIIYVILAIFLLRHLLLRYFTDRATAFGILLLVLATNLPQYAAVDGGMSHAYIFPLYVAVLYTTMRWHLNPKVIWALLTGWIIGLATICRPTEAIMLFIPLLWDTQTREASRAKWARVRDHLGHLVYLVLFGFLGILPQLIYWKIASGSFIFDVGSKWVFFNPFFRVLFGWESGWFIYTPVTIFFMLGFFYIRKYSFQRSVIVFCLLNIWIIISWFDWKYGATYSTRALVQSYPVFALPFTAFIERIDRTRWRYLFYLLGVYLIVVNLFQLNQYYNTVLHYRDMNRSYYSRIYMNRHPTPLDMSLLDSCDVLKHEKGFRKEDLFTIDSAEEVNCTAGNRGEIAEFTIMDSINFKGKGENWIRVTAKIKARRGFSDSYLNGEVIASDTVKRCRVRLFSPISQPGEMNDYAFYIRIPRNADLPVKIRIYMTAMSHFSGDVNQVHVIHLKKTGPP